MIGWPRVGDGDRVRLINCDAMEILDHHRPEVSAITILSHWLNRYRQRPEDRSCCTNKVGQDLPQQIIEHNGKTSKDVVPGLTGDQPVCTRRRLWRNGGMADGSEEDDIRSVE
jgi:hypothetical protein